ncbi:MAG: transcription antitermination factor NusB [Candidatus Goldiibacteriota bacterium HGW-Goldbacteria-1]|jgi:N utilization substance protein B|nr:MAG: transcription antitermination factor NusB [Candidatus Goldiibacteriota bacterium HGW-Goldbacteria-1]
MGIRRAGRIITLQGLYQMDIAKKTKLEIIDFIENYPALKLTEDEPKENFIEKSKEFAIDLINVIDEHQEEIDTIVPKYLKNWKFDRILSIDRCILRMGAGEFLFKEDIPYKVTINEAIELAKKFGDEKSGGFVNGVLDNIVKNEAENFPVLKKKVNR